MTKVRSRDYDLYDEFDMSGNIYGVLKMTANMYSRPNVDSEKVGQIMGGQKVWVDLDHTFKDFYSCRTQLGHSGYIPIEAIRLV